MDKATEKRFEKIVEHYRDIAERLGISLQELLLLVLSEQIKDISETMIPDIGSSEQESPKKATRKTTRKTTRRAQKEPQEEPPEKPGAQEMTVRELSRDQLIQVKR